MMIDSFMPEWVTQITVDSIFMMPQLGVLAKVHEAAAMSVFEKDCLIYLGTCIAPTGTLKYGQPALEVTVTMPDGKVETRKFAMGELSVLPLGFDAKGNPLFAKAVIKPSRGLDMGCGDGQPLETQLCGGVCGLIFDTRGRPFSLPKETSERLRLLQLWNKAMDMYPPR